MVQNAPVYEEIQLDPATKQMIARLNGLTGINPQLIRDVWEATFIDWIMTLTENPDKLQTICVPFLGSVGIRYKGDIIDTSSGKLKTEVDAFLSLTEPFKDNIGDIHDGKRTPVSEFIETHLLSRATGAIQNS
jgi:hypothetical protein